MGNRWKRCGPVRHRSKRRNTKKLKEAIKEFIGICQACKGTGGNPSHPCKPCKGTGQIRPQPI